MILYENFKCENTETSKLYIVKMLKIKLKLKQDRIETDLFAVLCFFIMYGREFSCFVINHSDLHPP